MLDFCHLVFLAMYHLSYVKIHIIVIWPYISYLFIYFTFGKCLVNEFVSFCFHSKMFSLIRKAVRQYDAKIISYIKRRLYHFVLKSASKKGFTSKLPPCSVKLYFVILQC